LRSRWSCCAEQARSSTALVRSWHNVATSRAPAGVNPAESIARMDLISGTRPPPLASRQWGDDWPATGQLQYRLQGLEGRKTDLASGTPASRPIRKVARAPRSCRKHSSTSAPVVPAAGNWSTSVPSSSGAEPSWIFAVVVTRSPFSQTASAFGPTGQPYVSLGQSSREQASIKTHTPRTQTEPHQPQTSPSANVALASLDPKTNSPQRGSAKVAHLELEPACPLPT
jgi:hypothetical protein